MSGKILIHPSIQARVDEMRRRQAEERADMHAAVAIKAIDRCNRITAEKVRLQEANGRLMSALHAVSGYPRLPMLPYYGEVSA